MSEDKFDKFETVAVCLSGRDTDDGVYIKKYIYSIRQRKLLEPKRTEKNVTEDRWDDVYFLLPGKYLVAEANVNGSNIHKCGYRCLTVFTRQEYLDKKKREYPDIDAEEFSELYTDKAWEMRDWQGYVPDWPIVPCKCLEVIKVGNGSSSKKVY